MPYVACLEVPCPEEAVGLHYGAQGDVCASTWYLNKTRIRTWDLFPVIVKIEVKEVKMTKGKKCWTGWTPVSKTEEGQFQEFCSCPEGVRIWIDEKQEDGLEALQLRFETAAGQVKATTMVSRNKKKFAVPDEIRVMAAMAAQSRDPVKRRALRKKAQKSTQGI